MFVLIERFPSCLFTVQTTLGSRETSKHSNAMSDVISNLYVVRTNPGQQDVNWQCHQAWPLRFSESGEPVPVLGITQVHFNGQTLLTTSRRSLNGLARNCG